MKKIKLLFILLILILSLFSCRKTEDTPPQAINMLFSGDIDGQVQSVDISGIDKSPFAYQKDGAEVSAEGYRLDGIINRLTPSDDQSWLIITARDNATARIDISNANLCYVLYEQEKFNIKAPMLPPAVGIKDVAEITVVSKNEAQTG
ncbi:MAG: hypothetical protein PHC84_06830, partial [Clostridia bacterium]|nr:hypothetical protein [Clostridia bacterium]